MALLFWDGFDSYTNETQFYSLRASIAPDYARGYLTQNPYMVGGGRYGGKAFITPAYSQWGLVSVNTAGANELYTGRALYAVANIGIVGFWGSAMNSGYPDIVIDVSGQTVRVIRYTSTGGASTILGQSTITMPYNAWHYMEVRCKMSTNNSTSDGIVQVWLNNQLIISLTNVITKLDNTSTYWYGTTWALGPGTTNSVWDDIYILDTSGSSPWNTRLGDLRIATVVPNADVGPNQGIQSTGATHYGVVDESTPDTSDYIGISSLAANNGELFAHTALPTANGNDGILATAVMVYAAKTDAGNANFKITLNTNQARYNSNSFALTTSGTYYRQDWITNPNTGIQWSNTDWHSANIGFYVV